MADRLLTIREAAGELSRSPRWLQRLAQEGRIPAQRFGGQALFLIRESDLPAIREMLAGLSRGRPKREVT